MNHWRGAAKGGGLFAPNTYQSAGCEGKTKDELTKTFVIK